MYNIFFTQHNGKWSAVHRDWFRNSQYGSNKSGAGIKRHTPRSQPNNHKTLMVATCRSLVNKSTEKKRRMLKANAWPQLSTSSPAPNWSLKQNDQERHNCMEYICIIYIYTYIYIYNSKSDSAGAELLELAALHWVRLALQEAGDHLLAWSALMRQTCPKICQNEKQKCQTVEIIRIYNFCFGGPRLHCRSRPAQRQAGVSASCSNDQLEEHAVQVQSQHHCCFEYKEKWDKI